MHMYVRYHASVLLCMMDISLTYFPIGGRTDAARWLNVAEWAGLADQPYVGAEQRVYR